MSDIVQNRKTSNNSENLLNPNLTNSMKTNSPRLAALLQEPDCSKLWTLSPQSLSKLSRVFLNFNQNQGFMWTQDAKRAFSKYFKLLIDYSGLTNSEFAKEMCRSRDFLFSSHLLPVYTEIDEKMVSDLCDSSFNTNFVENNRFLLSHICASIFALKMCTDIETLRKAQEIGISETVDDDY